MSLGHELDEGVEMKSRVIILGLAFLAALVLAQPSVTISPSTVAPGYSVSITIKGQAGETCGIEILDPLSNKVYVKQITLPTDKGTVSWQVPTAARPGTYTVFVSCEKTGAATASFTVTLVVGGEARRDFTPLLMTAALASALAFALAGVARRVRK